MKGQPVKAVENGVLKSFLMSRSPIDGFDHSTVMAAASRDWKWSPASRI